MNRPSHWILVFFALAGASLWLSGGTGWIRKPTEMLEASTRWPEQPEAPRSRATPIEAFRVEGQITDALGWPVGKAQVELFGPGEKPVRVLHTDSVGYFEAEIQGEGVRRLVASAEGLAAVGRRIQRFGPMHIVLHAEIPFEVPVGLGVDASVQPLTLLAGEGCLRDEAGVLVEDGFVVVAETGLRVRVNRHGRYRIPLPTHCDSITLVAYDLANRVARVEIPKPTKSDGLQPIPDLKLEPGSNLGGYLRDENGKPCPGASVVVREAHGTRRRVEVSPDGFFLVPGLLAGSVVLRVEPYRGHLGFAETLMLSHGNTEHDVTLQRHVPLHVTVVDATGQPQAGLHVVTTDAADNRGHDVTDVAGEADLDAAIVPIEFYVRTQELEACEVVSFDAEAQRLVVTR